MYKSFLTAVFLALFSANTDRIFAQATSANQKPPTSSTSTAETASAQRNSEVTSLYEEGLKRIQEGQISEALYRFQRAVEIDPEYADAYSALGRAYFKLRQWQNAVYNLRRATALKTKNRGKPKVQQKSRVGEPDVPATTTPSGPSGPKPEQQTDKKPAGTSTPGPTSVVIPKSEELDARPKLGTSVGQMKSQETNGNIADHRPGARPANITPTNSETELPVEASANADAILALATVSESAEDRVETIPTSSMQPTARRQIALKPLPINLEKLNLEISAGSDSKREPVEARVVMSDPPPPVAVDTGKVSPTSPSDEASLTNIYRVGPSDILDVRVNESESRQSTLFTVTPSGLLEHPLLVEPLPVAGLTVEEIGAKIENDLSKRALIADPNVVVGVRDYASHPIIVTGLVQSSGTKFLRREAIPLYVVVADAQPLPQAARVTVLRNETNQIHEIDLTQTAEMNFLVRPGDVITVKPNVTRFVYIAGEVKFPGEKTFHRGLTLMQAIIKAGGATRKSKVAEISRDDGRGFLVGTRFVLKDIESGKASDPLLQPGDRIIILR